MKFLYKIDSGKITHRYWGDGEPKWFEEPPEGHKTAKEGLSQQSLQKLMSETMSIYESGEDYDPKKETHIGYLCYDAESGEIYPAAEIKDIEEE